MRRNVASRSRKDNMKLRSILFSGVIAFILYFGMLPTLVAANTTHYLRPDGLQWSFKHWKAVGAPSVWEALDDPIKETETPTTADYISSDTIQESGVTFRTVNLTGVSVLKAQAWYYAANSQPFSVCAGTGCTYQTSNTAGWHMVPFTVTSQSDLDEARIFFRSISASSPPRQILAAFLKVETNGPRVYWGAWMDGDVYQATNPGLGDAPWDATTWSLFESHAERPASIVHFGQPAPWQQAFSSTPLELTRKGGSIPLMDMGVGCKVSKVCISGETDEEEDLNRVSLSEINEGKYDSYYETWAKAVANYKYPFFFRWAWEMNGTWFKWGRDASKSPAEFRSAWKHLHEIAETAGATNITWVWCPNVNFTGSTPLAELYPGDAYVDWTCLDGYNEGVETFATIFGASYAEITGSIAPSKPMMVAETATVENTFSVIAAEWIRLMFSSLPAKFPKIKALLWFNWNIVEKGKEWEWPIEWSNGRRKAFAETVTSPYFSADEFGSLPTLQRIKPLP